MLAQPVGVDLGRGMMAVRTSLDTIGRFLPGRLGWTEEDYGPRWVSADG